MRCFIYMDAIRNSLTYKVFYNVLTIKVNVSKLFNKSQLSVLLTKVKNRFILQYVLHCKINNIYCIIKYPKASKRRK